MEQLSISTFLWDNPFIICSVQEPVQQVNEGDSLDDGNDDMDEQARSSQHLSSSTTEISLPPSEDSDRMSGQVENDDGLGLVQSDTPVGAAYGDSTQITSTLTAFSVMRNISIVGLSVGIFVDASHVLRSFYLTFSLPDY